MPDAGAPNTRQSAVTADWSRSGGARVGASKIDQRDRVSSQRTEGFITLCVRAYRNRTPWHEKQVRAELHALDGQSTSGACPVSGDIGTQSQKQLRAGAPGSLSP